MIFCLLLVHSIYQVSAQSKVDSLKSMFADATDTAKVDILIELAKGYSRTDIDTAHSMLDQARHLATQVAYGKGVARATYAYNVILYRQGKYEEAIIGLKASRKLFLSLNDFKGSFQSYAALGSVFRDIGKMDSSSHYFRLALKEAQDQDNLYYIGQGFNHLGIVDYYKGDHYKALQNYAKASLYFDSVGNDEMTSKTYNNMAIIYRLERDFDKAIDYYYKAIEIIKQVGRPHNLITTYVNVATVLMRQGKKEEALSILLENNELSKRFNLPSSRAQVLHEVTAAMIDVGRNEEALAYADTSLQLSLKISKPDLILKSYVNRGNAHLALDNADKALESYKQAMAYEEKLGNFEFQFDLNIGLSRLYQKLGSYKKAEASGLKAMGLAKKFKVKQFALNSANNLTTLYEKNGDYKNALKYQRLTKTYGDSIVNENKSLEIGRLQAKYEFDQESAKLKLEQKEIEILNERKLSRQSLIRNMLLIVTVSVLLMSGLLYRNYTLKIRDNQALQRKNAEILIQKEEISTQRDNLEDLNKAIEEQKEEITIQNEILSTKNNELEKLNEEKDGLIGIVAHDLGAPLNRNKGFLSLLKLTGEVNKEQQEYIGMMERICDQGLSLIKTVLYAESLGQDRNAPNYERVELVRFLENLVLGYEEIGRQKDINIHFNTNVSRLSCQTDSNYMTRILENLMSNAIKFSHKHKNVYLTLEVGSTSFRLEVKDEGQGIDPDDQKHLFKKFRKLSAQPTDGESSSGLGLSIVKRLVEKLHGRVNVSSELGKGTEFTLNFPRTLG